MGKTNQQNKEKYIKTIQNKTQNINADKIQEVLSPALAVVVDLLGQVLVSQRTDLDSQPCHARVVQNRVRVNCVWVKTKKYKHIESI